MLVPHEDLIEQLERHEKEIKWIRISLWGAALLVAIYLPLLVARLQREEWAVEDFLYGFIVVIWVGIIVIQYKILQRKKQRRDRWLRDLEEPE